MSKAPDIAPDKKESHSPGAKTTGAVVAGTRPRHRPAAFTAATATPTIVNSGPIATSCR